MARNMPVARISRISQTRSSGIRDATKSSMRDGRLRHAAQPAFPDALGFLAGAAILNYLEDRLGRLAQLEFDCQLFVVSPDSHLYGFARLAIPHPATERPRHVRAVPAQDDVAKSQAGVRRRTAIVEGANCSASVGIAPR